MYTLLASSLYALLLISSRVRLAHSLSYRPEYADYNLNQAQDAVNPLDYSGAWQGHTYTPSPQNWRLPTYTLFLDRYVNGDPANDNANGTVYEQDATSTLMRHGGDIQGLIDSLDYIQGIGIKTIYISGPPFINQPWEYDSYSPLDQTLLDAHFGNIAEWRRAIDSIHERGMHLVLDNTVSTMGDLVGFEGYLNESAPFTTQEHRSQWKSWRRYADWNIGEDYNETCAYPRFWNETGYLIDAVYADALIGCYNSDFDQYGDTEAFGVYPDYRRALTKFASVQDRLREWVPSVNEKLATFSCLTIRMLDIDGFRFDKATQVTVDATGNFSASIRKCAQSVGKNNFLVAGEIAGGNNFGSIYLGRGRQPNQWLTNLTEAVTLNNETNNKYALRSEGQNALDAAAFHYSVYRSMTRFLGMDGNLAAGYDLPLNWADMWNEMLLSNDMVNAMTGELDPRHMLGTSNQDVFRWPSVTQGTERNLLAQFITTLLMPGAPLLLWGEEQAFYVLDNTADNYIFGRQAMSSSPAWYLHGCYHLSSTQYYQMPLDAARNGCKDITNTYDHRDPSHPIRNIIKHLYFLRENFPALQDGIFLSQLSNQTELVQFPGSSGTPTELGLWSVLRGFWPGLQAGFETTQNVWLVYHNRNQTTTYTFDCSQNASALISPFDAGSTVQNLFYPHETINLDSSTEKLSFDGSKEYNGCAGRITLQPYEFKAFVPESAFIPPPPMITKFLPGHDAHILTAAGEQTTSLNISFFFSTAMSCDQVTAAIRINSSTASGAIPQVDKNSIVCGNTTTAQQNAGRAGFAAELPALWSWSAQLTNVADGIHQITVANASTSDLSQSTSATDNFLIRVGKADNPVVFPMSANYSSGLLSVGAGGKLTISHRAAGADMWRYSTNWASSWSNWTAYPAAAGNKGDDAGVSSVTVTPLPWSGTQAQAWQGEHVIVQYWSRLLGSSSLVQHGDAGDYPESGSPRRFPHLFVNGPFNQYGFDAGISNAMTLTDSGDGRGTWEWNYLDEWPGILQFNVWGINPDGQPDKTWVYGDMDGDSVLDRLLPSTLSPVIINVTEGPSYPWLAWNIRVNDGSLGFRLEPQGDQRVQMAIFILLWIVPIAAGLLAVLLFILGFYKVKLVRKGVMSGSAAPAFLRPFKNVQARFLALVRGEKPDEDDSTGNGGISRVEDADMTATKRRTVLIATIEYNIDDWKIKVKIGGLGVMAQLMGKALKHQDLIWVVPCVGDIEYPDLPEEQAEPMSVQILDQMYHVMVRYHQLENITYVLLDAPVFRQQTRAEPYPPRMDNIESAIFYSAWNQCIAETIRRFPQVDIYHINDYHGGIAPLYLLNSNGAGGSKSALRASSVAVDDSFMTGNASSTNLGVPVARATTNLSGGIPCCLSLHNAEFQGLWPLRTPEERKEVCSVFNLPPDIVSNYVQYGSVFNLLHAAASYLKIHQGGFGAVGVSKKYGDRSFARYPIFWGLSQIGQLPNPDPDDMAQWSATEKREKKVQIDTEFEAARGDLRRQAQEWAGLDVDPDADLFVFVGRWSQQKGVDLIADIFPSILQDYPKTQLICVGPTIDLYGRFAARKLAKLMELYPTRVYSKPQFTALPPYIFSGAEFALIPSRDEPFGLVAVEFGRKGALGVGARVGGLGQMPGWWYTIESVSSAHLLSQFRQAIVAALHSKHELRAKMRAWSAKQRFPVAQWVQGLEKLQSRSIRVHERGRKNRKGLGLGHHLQLSMSSLNVAASREPGGRYPPFAPLSKSLAADGGGNGAAGDTDLPTTTSRAVSMGSFAGWPLGSPGSRDSSPGPSRPLTAQPLNSGGAATNSYPSSPSLAPPLPGYHQHPYLRKGSSESSRSSSDGSTLHPSPTTARFPDLGLGGEASERQGWKQAENEPFLPGAAQASMPGSPLTPFMTDGTPSISISHTGDTTHHIAGHGGPGAGTTTNSIMANSSANNSSSALVLQPPNPITGAGSLGSGLGAAPIPGNRMSTLSIVSVDSIVGSHSDLRLQQVDPFFTDSDGRFEAEFERRLEGLTAKNSAGALCIEKFLTHSERDFFGRLRDAKLGTLSSVGARDSVAATTQSSKNAAGAAGLGPESHPSFKTWASRSSLFLPGGSGGQPGARASSMLKGGETSTPMEIMPMAMAASEEDMEKAEREEFGLGKDYVPPTGLKKFLNRRFGEWPVYAILLALGQVLSTNSYQLSLFSGEQGQAASMLYSVASIYLVSTIFWGVLSRTTWNLYSLTLPWALYGLAFLLIGVAPFWTDGNRRFWTQNVATGFYAAASSSGAVFFAQNFGDEGGAPVPTWIWRACVVQGVQQVYSLMLWFWGSLQSSAATSSSNPSVNVLPALPVLFPLTFVIALCMWAIGAALFVGLPNYYRQSPTGNPSLYLSLFLRRKVTSWFFVSVILQNYFLSPLYGRSWTYLFSSRYVPTWGILILASGFFIIIWTIFLGGVAVISRKHPWWLPLFALGLGAPRWAQMLWGTSGLGISLPWAPTAGGGISQAAASALLGRSLWLWLGVLDSVQTVGLGMILLLTLTRDHVSVALLVAQVIGSATTMLARATAPNRIGPATVFPDFSAGAGYAIRQGWFWAGLIAQLVVVFGFFKFFRKEQISKP